MKMERKNFSNLSNHVIDQSVLVPDALSDVGLLVLGFVDSLKEKNLKVFFH